MLPNCTLDALTTETKKGSLVRAILNSHQLLAFVVLTRTGSFTLAGKQLFLTQSAVSHAIKALEDELGCALFERTGRGIIMTPAGHQFLPHAEKIMSEMKAARFIIEVEIKRMRAISSASRDALTAARHYSDNRPIIRPYSSVR